MTKKVTCGSSFYNTTVSLSPKKTLWAELYKCTQNSSNVDATSKMEPTLPNSVYRYQTASPQGRYKIILSRLTNLQYTILQKRKLLI